MQFKIKAFPQYTCDRMGFLYKNGKALKPRRHGLASHTGDFRFYITVDKKRYSCSQKNLRDMQENVIWRIEK